MRSKILKIIITLLIIAAGAFAGYKLFFSNAKTDDKTQQKKPPLVNISKAEKRDIAKRLFLTGYVEPYKLAKLASPAEGPVLNLHVREGTPVKFNDDLLSIGRKKGLEATIESYEEEFRKEEDNLKRTEELVQSGALPQEQLDAAKASFEKAKAQLIKAKEMELDFTVKAPWDGIVSKVLVKDGDYVMPRTPLVEIYDPLSLMIRIAVPEKVAPRIQKNLPAEVTLDAYPSKSFKAHVENIYPYLDKQTGTRTIEIKIDENVELMPGMFSRAKIDLEKAEGAIVIPVEALLTKQTGETVVLVVNEGKVKERRTELGIEDSGFIQIVSGINEGENVITSGGDYLKEGMSVRLPGSKEKASPQKDKSR